MPSSTFSLLIPSPLPEGLLLLPKKKMSSLRIGVVQRLVSLERPVWHLAHVVPRVLADVVVVTYMTRLGAYCKRVLANKAISCRT